MALTAQDKALIAKVLRIDATALDAALTDQNEVALTGIPAGLTALTDTELTERDSQKYKDGKRDGVNDGKEIAVKELKQKAGLTFEGKDPDVFITEFKKKEGAAPDSKVQELTKQVELLTADKTALSQQVTGLQQAQQQFQMDQQLVASFPKRKDILRDEDYLVAFKGATKIETVDGVQQVTYNGEVLRDKVTHKPLPLQEATKHVFADRGWIDDGAPASGAAGRGGSSSGTGGGAGAGVPTKYTEAQKAWTDQGKSLNDTPGFGAYVSGLKKDNPDFKMGE